MSDHVQTLERLQQAVRESAVKKAREESRTVASLRQATKESQEKTVAATSRELILSR